MTNEHICPKCGAVNEVRDYDTTVKYELGEVRELDSGGIEAPVEVWETKVFECQFCTFTIEGKTETTKVGTIAITKDLTGVPFERGVAELRRRMKERVEKPPSAHL